MPDTFISSFLRHTSIYESPTSFWKWAAYTTIAAVLRDQCWLPQGDSKLYPNVYTLLLAESSIHRKGRPIDLSETLTTKVNNTKIVSGRASAQAILDELSRAETDRKTGIVKKAGAAIFYASELSAGIVSDPEAIKILTDIYDYKTNPYKNRLRTGPCFDLERIVFSMFTASNEAMIKDFFDIVAIKGGMLARTFLVIPNEVREPNSLTDVDAEERKKSLNIVLSHMLNIVKLEGEFQWTEEGKSEYNQWYNAFRKTCIQRKETSGILGRIHTSIIKIAMIFAANKQRLTIEKEDIEESITECLSLIPNYSVFTMGKGKSDISQAGTIVVTDLLTERDYCLSRKEIIRRHWTDGIDAELLDKLIVTLEAGGMVQQIQSKDGLYIKLTETAIAMMRGEA